MKVRFRAQRVVEIHLCGYRKQGRFIVREDDDLVRHFLKFLVDKEISAARIQSTGPAMFLGYFYPKDAKKVIKWLKDNHATETDEVDDR